MNQESWGRVYRAVRVAKGFFDREQIVRVSQLGANSVYHFLRKMMFAGYIVEAGRNNRRIIYQGTTLLRNTPGTPPAKRRGFKMGSRIVKPMKGKASPGNLKPAPETVPRREAAQWLN